MRGNARRGRAGESVNVRWFITKLARLDEKPQLFVDEVSRGAHCTPEQSHRGRKGEGSVSILLSSSPVFPCFATWKMDPTSHGMALHLSMEKWKKPKSWVGLGAWSCGSSCPSGCNRGWYSPASTGRVMVAEAAIWSWTLFFSANLFWLQSPYLNWGVQILWAVTKIILWWQGMPSLGSLLPSGSFLQIEGTDTRRRRHLVVSADWGVQAESWKHIKAATDKILKKLFLEWMNEIHGMNMIKINTATWSW